MQMYKEYMKYANVFYVPHFNIIGGIETYCYELAKKYILYREERTKTRNRNSQLMKDVAKKINAISISDMRFSIFLLG